MALVILIGQEITAGVLVGAMARIIMSALQVAGFLIATQIGLAYAQTLDPTQNTQGAVVGNFLTLLGTVTDLSSPTCIIWRSAPSPAATACCRRAAICPPATWRSW